MKKLLFTLIAGVAVTAQAATEIEWWHAMNGASQKTLEKITEEFNASQTDYVVKPVSKGNYTETMTAAIAAFRAKKQPEIVQIYEDGTAMMMTAKGAIVPVEDVLNKYGKGFDKSSFLPALISYYQTPEGTMLSLPFNISTPILWYNKDAFKKAGITTVPTNWTEMDAAGDKLRSAGYECGYSIGWPTWVLIDNYGAWNDVEVVKRNDADKGLVTELAFNNEHLTNRLQKIKDSNNFVYGGRRGDSLPLYLSQKCPMWLNSSAYYGYISQNATFDIGMAMLPYDDKVLEKPHKTTLGGATLWVMNGHSDAEYKATAAFLAFLTKPEIQAVWHQETGNIPLTNAAYELSQQQGYYKKHPGAEVAIKQIGFNAPTPNTRSIRFGSLVQDRDMFEGELENIWNGNKTAVQAMDDAVKKGNVSLQKFIKANQ